MVLYYISAAIQLAVSIYTLVLLARMFIDWALFFASGWRPSGIVLVLINFVYALTDPPLRWLRRYVPPLRLGELAIDTGFIVLFVGVVMIGQIAKLLI